MLVSIKAVSLALLVATDRAADYDAARNTTDLAAQALLDMAEEYDSAARAYVRALERVASDAQGLLAGTDRLGVVARYGNVSTSASADAIEHAAKARALLDCWYRLANAATGAQVEHLLGVVSRQIGRRTTDNFPDRRLWVADAADVIRLALAMIAESNVIAAAARAARDALVQAEAARVAEEKKLARRARRVR